MGSSGSSSGSSSTTSVQPYILSGPTVQAAQSAADAEVQASQAAANAVSQNTQEAITELMNQYSTTLEYANPTINTGNQAEAQLNYMLGLPAVNPGPAPTAPTAPTAPSLSPQTLETQMQDDGFYNQNGTYINGLQNILNNSAVQETGGLESELIQAGLYQIPGTQNLSQGSGQTTGVTKYNAGNQLTENQPNPTLAQLQALQASNPTLYNQLATTLEVGPEQQYQTALTNYNNAETTYNQQLNQYNQQEGVYNTYSQLGTATPATINNIVSNLPGFQFNQAQGIQAIQNAASATGGLNSGNLLEQLNQYGQGLSEQYYQNYLSNLATEAGMGSQATSVAENSSDQLGSSLASTQYNLGASQANADLAAGQAEASSYLLPVANQEVDMYPYTTQSNSTYNSSSSSSGGIGGILGGLSQGASLLGSL